LNKRILAILIIILLIGVNASSVLARDVEPRSTVTFDGNTLYVGGSGPNNYTHIQDAINDASHYDNVFVYDDSSPYYETLIVDKSIQLIGENKESTVIDGNKKDVIILVNDSFITITGFMIQNTSDNGVGIEIYADNSCITDVIITNFKCGIRIFYSNNHYIYNNDFISGLATGIDLFGSSNNTITDNMILNQGGGIILFYSSNYNKINDNFIDKGSCYMSHSSNHNIWINNSIINHGGMCIYQGSSHNILDGNLFSNEAWECVRITGQSNNNTLINNIFRDSDNGVKIADSHQNKIYHNRFINNWRGNAIDSGNNIWDDGYPSGGNYWSDYTDNDYDNDTIGDSPYHIAGGDNDDNYPLGYFDYEPPIIDIISPEEGFFYFFNYKLFPVTNATVFIRPAVFTVNVTDDYLRDVYKISYYIDGIYKGAVGGLNKPYTFTFRRSGLIDFPFPGVFKHQFTITFEAVDCHGNTARENVTVWLFLS